MRFRSKALVTVLVGAIGLPMHGCGEGPTASAPGVSETQFAKGSGQGKPDRPPDQPIIVRFDDRANDNIRSDGRGFYESECNVTAKFNLNDAILNLKGRIKKSEQEACGAPRFIEVDFAHLAEGSPPGPQDGNSVQGSFMNVDQVETVELGGGIARRNANFQMQGCGLGLKFDPTYSEAGGIQVSDVDVTRISDDTWTIATRPFPDNVAVCVPGTQGVERSYYHMPVALTVTLVP